MYTAVQLDHPITKEQISLWPQIILQMGGVGGQALTILLRSRDWTLSNMRTGRGLQPILPGWKVIVPVQGHKCSDPGGFGMSRGRFSQRHTMAAPWEEGTDPRDSLTQGKTRELSRQREPTLVPKTEQQFFLWMNPMTVSFMIYLEPTSGEA